MHFVYKVIPPRAVFATTMSESEMAIFAEHVAYWRNVLEQGKAVAFGPVLDPSGDWGLAVVEADSEEEVRALADDDPAMTSRLCTYEIHVMPNAEVRPHQWLAGSSAA